MKTKILLIDGQIFQTEARDRGMGRYSVCLTQELIKSGAYDTVEILLSKNLPIADAQIKYLKALLPGAVFTVLNLLTTQGNSLEVATTHNKQQINQYISGKTNKNKLDYLLLSLFQEPTACVFPDNVKKLLVMYDIIPYLYHNQYEEVMRYEDYLRRFRYLFEADGVFCISESVSDDICNYLGIPRERVTSIDGAPVRSGKDSVTPSRIELPEHFVLMPTSDDLRKNNMRAVMGFEEYCASEHRDDLKLVITSTIREHEQKQLSSLSARLVFTGNLEDAELDWLYKECEAVLFVPESEGLGLPLLEAVEANKKVVCSSIPVFEEISKSGFYYCDHESPRSIAAALRIALNGGLPIPRSTYDKILKHYSWSETAKRFISNSKNIPQGKDSPDKLKIAIFAPRPSGLSAIGKVVAELHPSLSSSFDVDYYIEAGLHAKHVRPDYLKYVANCYAATDFSVEAYTQYDAVVYHIGNGDYHLESLKNGLYLPGYVILHDTNISEAFRVLVESKMMSPSRASLEAEIDKRLTVKKSKYIASLLNNQLGIMTHSKYAAEAAIEVLLSPDTPIVAANLPSATAALDQNRTADKLVIGMAGIIADVKGINVVEQIANDTSYKNCEIMLFGFNFATKDTLDRLNSYENVTVKTDLTDFEFQENLRKLDIFVNYRLEYKGETSLSTIEAMKNNTTVIVRDVGWYAELPDDVVVKAKSRDQVLDRLRTLVSDRAKLADISVRAKKYIETDFSHRQFVDLLDGLVSLPPASSKVALVQALKNGKIKTTNDYLRLTRRFPND